MFMPMTVNIEKKLFVVIGGGNIGTKRILKLLEFCAHVTLISPEINLELEKIVDRITWKKANYKSEFIKEADYVIAATNNEKLNREIRIECNKMKIPCLDVSNGKESDFYLPAVVNKGSIQISISTGGESPSVTKELKNEINQLVDNEYIERVIELSKIRMILKEEVRNQEERESLIRQINDLSLEDIILRRQHYENKNRIKR